MSKRIDQIKAAADTLDKSEQALAVAIDRLATVRGHGGQRGYSVSVNGVTVAVSVCDSRTYQGTLIRGREMIHLGALKALGAEVDKARASLKVARENLAAVLDGLLGPDQA